jgi:hypothetical protein
VSFYFLATNSSFIGGKKSFAGYVEKLMIEVTAGVENTPMPHCEPDEVPDNPPPLCAEFDHPQKDDAINTHITRFH